jgi:DNA invertase Pin-like site-specific DNA recombinase
LIETLHIYSRVSTSSQEDDGTSLDTQKELGIKKSKELGFQYSIWDEGGQSSSKDDLNNRPVLKSLLSKIESGEVKHIFVFNTDRLSRNETTWGVIRLILVKYDVNLHTPSGMFYLSNPMDKLLLGVLTEFSSYDNSIRTERTRLGKWRRIKEGFWLGGPPPYGYKIVDKILVPNEEEVEWVKFIFHSYLENKSIRDIRQDLMINGVKTRRDNPIWSLGSIEKLIRNTHYSGFFLVTDKKSGETVTVNCEPILSFSLYSEVQKLREKRSLRRVKESNQKHFYLLRDFLVCEHCGCYFSGKTQPDTSRSVYYCPRKERNFSSTSTKECLNTRYLKIDETDNLIWNSVVDVLSRSHQFKEDVKKQVLGQSTYNDQKNEVDKLRKSLKSIDLDIKDTRNSLIRFETDRLLNKYGSEDLKKIIINIENHNLELKTKREELLLKIHSIENQTKWVDWISEFGNKLKKLNDLTPEEKRDFLSKIIENIIVSTVDTQTHNLKIKFKLAYIDDRLIWNEDTGKKKKYIIEEGTNIREVEISKKKHL